MSFRAPVEIIERLELYAASVGEPRSVAIRRLIERALDAAD